ncbi:MAG: metallophosphoesterase [Planctomycetes bacterium]|nr:metallophosphoesterase [Planctomycetota bacterium]
MSRFKIETFRLPRHSPRPGSNPLNIAQISDTHFRSWRPEHERLVRTVNGLNPDVVLLTGDLITAASRSLEAVRTLCRKLEPRYGLYAVRGNWEIRFAPTLRKLRAVFADAGCYLLKNEQKVLKTKAGNIAIAGLDDLTRGAPDIEETLRSSRNVDFRILLSHAPLAARLLPPGHNVDLILTGHTHGGQIRIPWLWRLLLPTGHGGFSKGLYKLPHCWLYVNRGFGSTGPLRLRFRCPPEVAFFKIGGPLRTEPGKQ